MLLEVVTLGRGVRRPLLFTVLEISKYTRLVTLYTVIMSLEPRGEPEGASRNFQITVQV